ncbi:MAG: hypothetical protein KBA71_09260 [Opitutaceae bacterium]|nr:hypothetical protein [Opitutaceae bacterium]
MSTSAAIVAQSAPPLWGQPGIVITCILLAIPLALGLWLLGIKLGAVIGPEKSGQGSLLMINAYAKGDQKQFVIYGSESPRGIPSWVIILLVLFGGWSVYYLARYLSMAH